MSVDKESPSGGSTRRDDEAWAKPTPALEVTILPEGAINRNVAGRRVTGPIQGFGRMWQKTYRVRMSGVDIDPTEVIKTWKEHFPEFWPEGNRFYGPLTGIAPGEVAVLNLSMPGRLKLSTGVMVMYADDESFTFMTPEGHMFAGWITFSAFKEGRSTVAQAQVLIRASDPLYELGLALGGHEVEDRFWQTTLTTLAARFGVEDPAPETRYLLVDRKRQWRMAKNVWHNAGVRSGFYMMGMPARWASKRLKRKSPPYTSEGSSQNSDL
ncbi:MAG: hypothetical protein GEU78_02225 [Actinobacteria bacterium]|nr:hypothetical protein [Actinomycetota bacterium]